MEKIQLNTYLVQALVAQQFPKWSDYPIKPVTLSGWDNYSFHLGDDLLIRLPSAACYQSQVQKEHYWLPRLATHLSIPIPEPVALGQANESYPFNWSIYKWLPGQSANQVEYHQDELLLIAKTLADFLGELQRIDATHGPESGEHNFFRGAHPSVYHDEAIASFEQLDRTQRNKAMALWQQACTTAWTNPAVWLHGDIAPGNLLIENQSLSAIIDFGCMGIGDPACDLMIAWTFFNAPARQLFKRALDLDEGTWLRAKAWTLWKILLPAGPKVPNRNQILTALLNEK